ncbi:hypothetical protein HYU13_04355 [Candidatus Woesearchaeota archaeon]|nr:hypothetical protein [Candidatus Woesearchaeota archaeon]
MHAYKSRAAGIFLALFTGPFSCFYIGKWKKTLFFIPFFFIPWLNILAYLIVLFSISSDIRKHNAKTSLALKHGVVECKCKNLNPKWCNYCQKCGRQIASNCAQCNAWLPESSFHCGRCGNADRQKLRKARFARKAAVFGISLGILALLSPLTLLVAQAHQAEKYLEDVKLVNFMFPERTSIDRFHIHYELSEKKLPSVKSLNTYITGDDVYTIDNESAFDGKNIEWIVHAKRKGLINFNVSLYDNDKLIDFKEFRVEAN